MRNNFWQRLQLYFNERYPLVPAILTGILFAFGIFFSFAFIFPLHLKDFIWQILLIFFMSATFPLLLRISDEFKDIDTDKELFADRVLSRGLVEYRDIAKVAWFLIVSYFICNVFFGGSLLIFFIFASYHFLVFKYFFLPKIISNNLILALLTHNPVMLIFSLYLCSIITQKIGGSAFSTHAVSIAIIFWLPAFIWEISRKIKAPHDENEYNTYSKILGYRIAPLLPLVGALSQIIIAIRLTDTNIYFTVSVLLPFILLLGTMLRFIIRPTSSNANKIRPATELYLAIFFALFSAAGAVNYFDIL